MFNVDLIVLSYHRFVYEHNDYRFSRTYDQFGQDISKMRYDWITIDDNMKCMIKACDMLRYCNIRAKLFICTSLVGQPGYCTWEEIRELSKYHDIENHGHVHEYHTQMDAAAVVESISQANKLIRENVGRTPRYFVPPYNTHNTYVEWAAKEYGLILVKDRINILNTTK
jgi:peptidoglycan/xylan/chitin deacetylase (PgdA/CDA1 family)